MPKRRCNGDDTDPIGASVQPSWTIRCSAALRSSASAATRARFSPSSSRLRVCISDSSASKVEVETEKVRNRKNRTYVCPINARRNRCMGPSEVGLTPRKMISFCVYAAIATMSQRICNIEGKRFNEPNFFRGARFCVLFTGRQHCIASRGPRNLSPKDVLVNITAIFVLANATSLLHKPIRFPPQ